MKERKKGNKVLSAILLVLCVLIIALIVAIIIVKNNVFSEEKVEVVEEKTLIDTSEAFPDISYEDLSEATKAFVLGENIQEKMDSDPEYTIENGMNDYDEVYTRATGDLKVYVAINYANFVYEATGDLGWALEILSVENELSEGSELDYYYTLLNLYTAAGDSAKAEEYQRIIDEETAGIEMDFEEDYE